MSGISLYHQCAMARTMDELRLLGDLDGLQPVCAQWTPEGELLEVQFASLYSGELVVKYTYER